MISYILLGIVQGFTEFLPVSSSGHLVVLQRFLSLTGNELEVSIVLHLGTLFSILVFFRRQILAAARNLRLLFLIGIVTVITGVIGIAGKDYFESLFSSTKAVAIAWAFSGVVLLSTGKFMGGQKKSADVKDSILLGFTQGLAIIPGVSRSGITISTLLFAGIDKTWSFVFSFLVSIPVILGAALFDFKKISNIFSVVRLELAAGFLASFVCGMAALWILKRFIDRSRFFYFGFYCLALAVLTFFFVK